MVRVERGRERRGRKKEERKEKKGEKGNLQVLLHIGELFFLSLSFFPFFLLRLRWSGFLALWKRRRRHKIGKTTTLPIVQNHFRDTFNIRFTLFQELPALFGDLGEKVGLILPSGDLVKVTEVLGLAALQNGTNMIFGGVQIFNTGDTCSKN